VSMSHRLAVGLAAVGLVACSVTLSYAQGTVTGNRPAGGAGTAGTRPVGAGAGAGAGAVAPASATSMSSGSRTAGTSVVVIDIGEVFKQHAQFNKQLTGLKDEMKNLESYYQGEQRRVAQKRDELSTFNPGSAQYKKLEEEAARMVSDLQVERILRKQKPSCTTRPTRKSRSMWRSSRSDTGLAWCCVTTTCRWTRRSVIP
jgi:hypothetical protein